MFCDAVARNGSVYIQVVKDLTHDISDSEQPIKFCGGEGHHQYVTTKNGSGGNVAKRMGTMMMVHCVFRWHEMCDHEFRLMGVLKATTLYGQLNMTKSR